MGRDERREVEEVTPPGLGMSNYVEMFWKQKWVAKKVGMYPSSSCKDAHVPPEFPPPQCDCSKPTWIKQSTHPSTAARAFYMCGDYRECCYFFQWIDRPKMYNKTFVLQKYMLNYAVAPEAFTHWEPPSSGSGKGKGKAPMVPDAPVATEDYMKKLRKEREQALKDERNNVPKKKDLIGQWIDYLDAKRRARRGK